MNRKDKIKNLRTTISEDWKGIKVIQEAVVAEARDYTPDERGGIEKALDKIRATEVEVQVLEKDETMEAEVDRYGSMFKSTTDNDPVKKSTGGSIGSQFTSDPRWQAWMKSIAPEGRIPDSARGINSPVMQFKSLGLLDRKELLVGDSDISAGVFVESERTGIYETLGRHALTLRNLITVRQTGSDAVEFVRQTVQALQAAPVAESNVTTFSGATGEISGEKPEATVRFERITEVVKTIAVWIPATKRAISDAAQLRGIIDTELREDLNEELEDQLLNGSGVGENFTGLANTAGVLVQTFDTDTVVTARKAITNLLINGRQMPTAYLLNPLDWEGYDLAQDTQGRYYWGGPQAMGPRTLWGVPVAQSFFQPQGTGWLANWRKAVLWDREQANISVSDSHADFFIRNMVAVLAELRAAFGIIRPSAFVEIDLTSGS